MEIQIQREVAIKAKKQSSIHDFNQQSTKTQYNAIYPRQAFKMTYGSRTFLTV